MGIVILVWFLRCFIQRYLQFFVSENSLVQKFYNNNSVTTISGLLISDFTKTNFELNLFNKNEYNISTQMNTLFQQTS